MTDVPPIDGGARAGALGWRAQRRPAPGFAHVLGAVAGAFAVIALVAFIVAADRDDPQVPGVVLSVVVIAAALGLGALGHGPLRSAGTTAILLTVPLLWVFALVADGDAGRDSLRGVLLLTLGSYGVLYAFGWTKGRAVFLGGALVLLVYWLGFEVAGSGDDSIFGGSFSDEAIERAQDVDSSDDAASAAVMLLGLAYLIVGGLLDRRRLAGAATPLLAVGAVAAVGGGVTLAGAESALAAGIVAVLLGAAVGVIGAAGQGRRGTTWFGALAVFGGLVAILVDVAPSDEAGIGGIALGIAVVCGALAWWLAGVLGEPDDGDDRPLPPPAPEGGASAHDASPAPVAGDAAA
jgi:hypothetical protein